MDTFLTACLGFPTVLFTVGLGVALCYWTLVILGALDLDLSGGHHPGGDLHHGPGDLHQAGPGHQAAHGGGDGHHGVVGGQGFWHGFLDVLAVGTVPVTISATCLLLAGWLWCMLGTLALLPLAAGLLPGWLASGLLLLAALVLAIPATGLGIWPFRLVFRHLQSGGQASKLDLIGRPARITSLTADIAFGTAVCLAGDGAEHVINVTVRPGLAFRKDDQVVVVSHDDRSDRYLVGPLVWEPLAGPHASLPAPDGARSDGAPEPPAAPEPPLPVDTVHPAALPAASQARPQQTA